MRSCETCAYSMTEGRREYQCTNPDSKKHGEIVGHPTLKIVSKYLDPKFDMVWSLGCGHYRKG